MTMQASLAYNPPSYDLLPKGFKSYDIEKDLFRFVLWILGVAIDWAEGLRKPTLGKLAAYFIARYLLNLLDHIIESFFDWLIQPQGKPAWQNY